MALEKIGLDRIKEICASKGLKPGAVKGTKGIQFTKGNNPRIEEISWEDFESRLKARGLAVFESGGWMKVMKE